MGNNLVPILNTEMVIKPHECIILFGIPTKIDKNSFYELNNLNTGFISNFNNDFSKYSFEIINPIIKFEKRCNYLGVSIIHNCTINSIEKVIECKKYKCIILFTHWEQNKNFEYVQFNNSYVKPAIIASKIPVNYVGIIDLCICHPKELVKMLIEKKRKKFLVRYISIKTTPIIWLEFYWTLFFILYKKEITYLAAIEEVVNRFKDMKIF